MIVHGLDLSLAATGRAWLDLDTGTLDPRTLGTSSAWSTLERIRWIVDEVVRDCALVAIEGPSYASAGTSMWERAGLFWMTLDALERNGVPYAVIPPKTLKKYATGSGNANKTAMTTALSKRLGDACPDVQDDNQVDACWLALAAGHRVIGAPVVPLPAPQVAALSVVEWPELLSDDGEPETGEEAVA